MSIFNRNFEMIKNKNFRILCCLTFLNGFVFYAPVSTIFRQSRGLSMKSIFILDSVLLICLMLFEVPWGVFTDKFGYKKTLILASFFLFLSKLIFFFSDNVFLFIIHALITGISFSGFSGCTDALIYESINSSESEKYFGIYNSIGTIGFILASLASGIFIAISMDFAVFITIIPFGLAFLLCFFIDDVVVENSSSKTNFYSILKNLSNVRVIFIFILSTAIVSEISHAIGVSFGQLKFASVGIPFKFFGIITVVSQIACLTSGFVHKLTSKYGQFKTIIFLITVMNISLISLIVSSTPLLSVTLAMIIQASGAMIAPISFNIKNRSIKTNRATMLSIYSMFSCIITSIINFFLGMYGDISLSHGLKFSWVLLSFALISIILYSKMSIKFQKSDRVLDV